MTELSDSVAIYKQLDLPESEHEHEHDELFVGNLSQNSTPDDTPVSNSNNPQHNKTFKRYNNEDENTKTNIEYNDTIDEYVETNKKKAKGTSNKNNVSNTSSKKRTSSAVSKKKTSNGKTSATSLKNSLSKSKTKSIRASHSTMSTSRSTNFNKPPTSSTTHKKKQTITKIGNKQQLSKTQKANLFKESSKLSKNTISSNNSSKNKNKQKNASTLSKNQSNTSLPRKPSPNEENIPSNTSIENPITEQANVDTNEQGLTQLIFNKDESNDASPVNNVQRIPARKTTRRDSYRHSIMVVQEKLMKKEEEKGEANKISFNDNEHQIRRKRSTLGDFKDIDENPTKPPPKLRKSSRKFTVLRPSSKAVSKKNENENTNSNNTTSQELIWTNNEDVEKKKEVINVDNSPIMEEKHEYGSTEHKKQQQEIGDKFMKLFNEVKGKLLNEKEHLIEERKRKLKKSISSPLFNSKNSKLFNSKQNSQLQTKKQMIADLLKQNAKGSLLTDRQNKDLTEEELKRRNELKSKFNSLKRKNGTHSRSNHKANGFTNSASLLKKQEQYNKRYNVNGNGSFSEDNGNGEEGKYKTFEELKSKAAGLALDNLMVIKSLGFVDGDGKKGKYVKNKNKSTKAKNGHYKGLSLSQMLLHSELMNGNCDLYAKVFPPNAMEKSKFNYFVE